MMECLEEKSRSGVGRMEEEKGNSLCGIFCQ